jgi:anaerobic dimethyl sulfoxide reductase subunit C (anchor subunit)
MKAGSLVAFTLLSQTAVGAYLILMVFFGIRPGSLSGIWVASLILIIILMAAGMVISFLHLGSPLKALYALTNLSSSWLSREVALASLFIAFSIFLLGNHLLIKSAGAAEFLTIAGILVSLALLFSMSKIYMVRTIPAWNSFVTMLTFAAVSLLLGGGLLLVIFSIYLPETINQEGSTIFWGMFVAAFVDLLLFYWRMGLELQPAKVGSIKEIGSAPRSLQRLHALLLILGMVIFWLVTVRTGSGNVPLTFAFFLAFVFLVIAEIIHRHLFYRLVLTKS